ncbi:MAG TPA: RagB/SusD family nutrient uptake outer membrane protein [Puia sp.]|nr:RagB/SusD family nutrient uptake outer membrane protein [Puia sp.]
MRIIKYLLYPALMTLLLSGCKKLVSVPPPPTSITGENVFTSDATAIAVITGIYTKMSQGSFACGATGISFLAGLSSDEYALWNGVTVVNQIAYYRNNLAANTAGFELWNNIYPYVYACNDAIDQLSVSVSLTPAIKTQLLGEAKFIRAFCYFYLTGLYGDLPLVLSTDYKSNASLPRTSQAQIYQQIVMDLKTARDQLSDSYLNGTLLATTTERIRPTKAAANAMLARTYLYAKEYDSAEAAASVVLNNSVYALTSLDSVFLKNSHEAIWQLQPVSVNPSNTLDGLAFNIPRTGPNATSPISVSSIILNSFETGDQRKAIGNWIDSVIVSGTTWYFPYKYKASTGTTVTEYTMVLRLGEQYLIRAEARAQQGNISGAQADLNAIRARAGLPPTTASDKTSLLAAIAHERQVELFSEWGHRWLDLKRTGTVDNAMSIATPQKSGGAWNTIQQWYPLPQGDIQKDPNAVQNPGY